MNSKHPEDIHGHLQRAKCVFSHSEYFGIFPNISEYFRIKKLFFIPNQWETLHDPSHLCPPPAPPTVTIMRHVWGGGGQGHRQSLGAKG